MIIEDCGHWINPQIITDRIDSAFYQKKDIDNLKFLIGSGFELKNLMEMSVEIVDGPHDGYIFVNQGVLFIRSQNIKNMGFDFSDKKLISDEFNVRYKKSCLESGDLLITRIGEYYGNAAVVSSEVVGCNINHAIAKVKLMEKYDPYFVCAYIYSNVGNKLYRRLGKSFTSPRVNLSDFGQFLVPIPSDNIQKFIGNKVRKAEELREEARKLRDEALSILQAGLKINQFTRVDSKFWNVDKNYLEPYLNTNFYNVSYIAFQNHLATLGVSIVELGDILKRFLKNNSPDERFRVEKGIPSLIVSDIDPNEINTDSSKIKVSRQYYEEKRKQELKENDVVYTTAGPPLGEACLVVNEMLPLLSGAHVMVLRLKDNCYPGYLSLVLNSIVGELEVRKHSYGIRQQYLFNEQLFKFRIPLLKLDIQKIIHEKISNSIKMTIKSSQLIAEAKQDVEDLIEGKFDESKISEEV